MTRWLVLGPVWAWLLLFIAAPALIVLALSFSQAAVSVPPYDPLVTWEGWWPSLHLLTDNYAALVEDDFYLQAGLQSLLVASVSSVLCLLIGYPMALAIARAPERWRSLLLLLVMLPFWTGFLLRIVAWIGLLGDGGWINAVLLGTGLIAAPLHMLYTRFAMYVGIVYCYLPFMVLPLYARLSKLDPALEEAAADLGAGRGTRVRVRDVAAVAARHRRRVGAGVHAGSGRVRDPGTTGRSLGPDGRARVVERVLRQPRLADGRGAGECAADRDSCCRWPCCGPGRSGCERAGEAGI